MDARLICTPSSLLALLILLFSPFAGRAQENKLEHEPAPDLRTRTDGSDWPGLLGPNRDGKSPETGILTTWPPAGPPQVWERRVGEGYSMPVVAKGRIFLFARYRDSVRIEALESETGKELWQIEHPTVYEDAFGYSNGPRAPPLVDDDRLYTHGVDGFLRCHRVVDGKLLWEVDTFDRFGVVPNYFGVGSSPVVENDLLLVPVGGSPTDSPKNLEQGAVRGNGTGLVAFDKRTGRVRYAVTDELASYASPVVTTIADRRWGFHFARGGLLGFEPTTGKVDFHFPWRARRLFSVNASNPVIVGDRVFVSESYERGGALLRVEPGGYEVLWKDPPGRGQSMATHWSTPIHHDGFLYGSSGEKSGEAELRSVELQTGRVSWRQPGLRRVTLLYVDNHFVVLTEYGELLLIEANPEEFRLLAIAPMTQVPPNESSTGRRLGRPRPLVRYPAWSPPVLSHGLLYVRGSDRLVALELIPSRE